VKAKPNQLKAQWSKRHKDIVYVWGDDVSKGDSRLLHNTINVVVNLGGKSLQEELIARGYDITTLKFSIQKHRPLIQVLTC